ncbi:PspA/IM30 family protein [Emticicia fontis]
MWTNLLKRILNISKSKAHDTLDQIEDPVQMMKLAVAELEQAIAQITKALSIAMANQLRLEKDHEQFKLEGISWYQKAANALQSGNEELAKKALSQKALAEKKEIEYGVLAENSRHMVQELNVQLDEFKLKLEEAKTKQRIYAAKAESAKAQKQISESLGRLNSSALANMSKYEDKINQLAAEAESLTALNSMTHGLNREFREMENDMSVQSDLAQLKNQLAIESEKQKEERMNEIQQKFNELNQSGNQLPQSANPKPDVDKLLNDFFKQ